MCEAGIEEHNVGPILRTYEPMTTVTIAKPSPSQKTWHVYGTYIGRQDRYVFIEQWIHDRTKAEKFARLLIETYQADHLGRQ